MPQDYDKSAEAAKNTLGESKYQPKRQDSKPIDYDFTYQCPPEMKALGDARHGGM